MFGKICATGVYCPGKILSNDDLSKLVDTNDIWIQERTGVKRRHIIEEDTTVTMAAKAAKNAMDTSGIQPEEIDMIIVSTISSNVIMPCAACEVQRIIGAVNASCFDLNAACSGFLFAYNTAQMYIAGGIAKTILVIGAESLSNLLDWTDRGTCILFGDGAGAVILKADEHAKFETVVYSDGNKGNALTLYSRHQKDWDTNEKYKNGFMAMDGREVFQFAVTKVPKSIEALLGNLDKTQQDIDYYVLHQANKRIVESVAKRLKEHIDKFPINMQEYGNTSSASIPILLHEMKENKVLKAGSKIVLAGFGAGLSWGASYLEW